MTNRTSDNQTQKIIKVSATTTENRKARIMDLLMQINHNSSNEINGFGINVGNRFIDVTARKLNPPMIQYKNDKVIKPIDGVWNMMNAKFLLTNQSTTEFKWGILNADSYTNDFAIRELSKMVSLVNCILSSSHDFIVLFCFCMLVV